MHIHMGRTILGYTAFLMQAEIAGDAYSVNRRSSYRRHRQILWVVQKGICHWCGKQCNYNGNGGEPNQFTTDHIIPLSVKGTNHWRNLVGSCHACNNARAKEWQFVKLIVLEKVENECTVA